MTRAGFSPLPDDVAASKACEPACDVRVELSEGRTLESLEWEWDAPEMVVWLELPRRKGLLGAPGRRTED